MTRTKTVIGVLALVLISTALFLSIPPVLPPLIRPAICDMPVAMPPVVAKAAYVQDLASGSVLFEKESHAQLPLASLTKLMTILIARHNLTATTIVPITQEALEPEGDSGLKEGEAWSAGDLADFTLVTSSNDGVHALALAAADREHSTLEAFISSMNAKAAELGLTTTYFLNDTGLDVSTTTAGAYGSARDIATLLTDALHEDPPIVEGSASDLSQFVSLSGYVHVAEHTSTLTTLVSGVTAVKTGFTDLAGGNLAALLEVIPGRPVVVVVLGSTREARDTDAAALATASKHALVRATLCKNGD